MSGSTYGFVMKRDTSSKLLALNYVTILATNVYIIGNQCDHFHCLFLVVNLKYMWKVIKIIFIHFDIKLNTYFKFKT